MSGDPANRDLSFSATCNGTITRMKLTSRRIASGFFVILSFLVAPTSAEVEAPEVRVAVVVVPPLVMEQNGSLTGFSVELWSAIAKRLKLETSYQVLPDGSALEEAMRSKRADLTPTIFIPRHAT